MALDNRITKELDTVIRKYAKFEDEDIKNAVYRVIECLDSDLDAIEFGPSSGENSLEAALENMDEVVSDHEEETSLVEVDDEPDNTIPATDEDDDKDDYADEDDEVDDEDEDDDDTTDEVDDDDDNDEPAKPQ